MASWFTDWLACSTFLCVFQFICISNGAPLLANSHRGRCSKCRRILIIRTVKRSSNQEQRTKLLARLGNQTAGVRLLFAFRFKCRCELPGLFVDCRCRHHWCEHVSPIPIPTLPFLYPLPPSFILPLCSQLIKDACGNQLALQLLVHFIKFRYVAHTPCWTTSILFSLAITKPTTKPTATRTSSALALASTQKRFSENKLKIFGKWFDVLSVSVPHSIYIAACLYMSVHVCACCCCLLCLFAFALISVVFWLRAQFCNRCQRCVVCFLTCFTFWLSHNLIDYSGCYSRNVSDNCSWIYLRIIACFAPRHKRTHQINTSTKSITSQRSNNRWRIATN